MKRFLICILAVLMIVPSLSVGEDQDILVTEGRQAYDHVKVLGHNVLVGDNIIWIYFELRNVGNNPLVIDEDHSCVQFLDSAGNVYLEYYGTEFATTDPSITYTHLPVYPYKILPGERFFVIDSIYNLPDYNAKQADAYQQILKASDYRLNLKLINAYDPYSSFLPVTGSYKLVDVGYPALRLTYDVTNNTGKDIDGLVLLYISRDKNGNPALLGSDLMYSEYLSAGETKHYEHDIFDPDKLDFLIQHNFAIDNLEILVYGD